MLVEGEEGPIGVRGGGVGGQRLVLDGSSTRGVAEVGVDLAGEPADVVPGTAVRSEGLL